MNKMNSKLLIQTLVSGCHAIINNSDRIDAMNVFPVPDGDTGSNMSATVRNAGSAVSEMQNEKINVITKKFSREALLGARGNSGVILSQIIKGFSVAFEKLEQEITINDFINGFALATDYAYKSVMEPVEGTLLTVIRMVNDSIQEKKDSFKSMEELFSFAHARSIEVGELTPSMLPVLKEVGVTDSGGEGFIMMMDGWVKGIEGKPFNLTNSEKSSIKLFEHEDYHDGEFGYCTEFIIEITDPKNFKKSKFEKELSSLGDSFVIVHDEDILKVHLHTLKPGDAFNVGQKYGEFLSLKSENMTIQANESTKSKGIKKQGDTTEIELSNRSGIGVISVHSGQGIIEQAKEYGANYIIKGGQSMNPSASDFIDIINKADKEKIIILPNNSNIILVAQQVAQTMRDIEIIIIPSKTQMQGLTALLNFDNTQSLEHNKEQMTEALNEVETIQVTIANRTTKIAGSNIKEGEFISILGKKIYQSNSSKLEVTKSALEDAINDESEIVTIYFGSDATNADAEQLQDWIEMNKDVEVDIKDGGQQLYHFLISVE